MKKEKVLVITSWYPSEKDKISGSFVKQQVQMLKDNGHDVIVLHTYLKGTFLSSINSRKSEESINVEESVKVLRVGVSPYLPKLRSLTYKKLYRKSKDLLIRTKLMDECKVIHSHSMFMGGVIGNLLAQKFQLKHIHTEHASGLIFKPNDYSPYDQKLLKKVYSQSNQNIFVSNYSLSKMIDMYDISKHNCCVIGNLVDNSFFNNKSIIKKSSSEFRYLCIGRFIEVKDHNLLLESWSILLNEFPNSKLTLIGSGKLENSLKIKALELKIADSILWLESRNHFGIQKEIIKADVVVSSSKLETFGLTIAEANAMGKPVVVSPSGGVYDIVNDLNGIITNESVNSFAKGLAKVQREIANYSYVQIRKQCYSRFSEEEIYKKLSTHLN